MTFTASIFRFTLLLLLVLSAYSSIGQDYQITRQPALNPDGSQLAFSYQGDIWTVPVTGGQAYRLTIHEAYESSPQWSPDGKSILFNSQRNGNGDLYTIKPDGTALNRITYHSASDTYGNWVGNDRVTFSTSRNFKQLERESEFHEVKINGGTPMRIMDALGTDLNNHKDGKIVAFVRGGCRIEREAYRGPANRDIWVYNKSNGKYLEVTNDEGQDVYPEWGMNKDLYFLSARDGRYNIYKTTITGDGSQFTTPIAITNYRDEGIREFDVSADGRFIVYTYQEKIHLYNLATGKTEIVKVMLGEDYRFDPVLHENVSSMDGYALTPDEKFIAYTSMGDLFFKQNDKDKKRSINPLSQSSRESNVAWLNDSVAMFLSDRGGSYDIYLMQSEDKKEPNIFSSFKWKVKNVFQDPKDVLSFVLSPDRDKIAITLEPGTLIVSQIDSTGKLDNKNVLLDGWDSPGGVCWSPDGEWLAYAQSDLNFNSEIFILKADGSSSPVNISMHPRGDYSPVWSRDGSKLGFISIRNNGDADIWFAWLKEEDYEKTSNDWEEMNDEEEKSDKKEEKEEKIEIDLDGIHERLIQVTSLPGNEGDLVIGAKGEMFYFSTNNGGRTTSGGKSEYNKIKWNGKDSGQLMSNGSVSSVLLDKSGKNIYYNSRGKLSKVDVKSGKSTSLPHSAKIDIPTHEYRAQVFDEAWRTINDRFYDPKFHGQDWNALRAKYRPRALAASTNQDFRMLVNEMLGQINASHMGLYGSGPEETQNESTGLIGIEGVQGANGLQITYILPDSPADKEESKLAVGDVISSINGKAIDSGTNWFHLLNGKANERVLLEVISSNNSKREVIIRPVSSLGTERYESWVDMQKKLTEEYSGGRLGYIHIRGMNLPSFERFERELMASGYGKEGVVIDVRYNGGGWTTDMVMAVLNVRQHAYTIPRGATDDLIANHRKFKENYPYGERLPLSALTKPSVALCNESSYSNAEIFSHAFKTLGHGKLVGQPTFGAVISTGGRGLMDGSFVRVPFRAWYVKATEENMELGPAVPDHIVENEPDAKAKGMDLQLKKAVEVLLEQIDSK